jgi:GNAT superfamily N-acetyltransferase
MIRIEPYRADMRDEILALLGNKPHRMAIWDWQFNDSPFGRSFAPVVASDNGRIIGFNAVMPVDVMYSGSVIEAVWSCDFFVNPAYRGGGTGRRIKERLISQSALILSLGISDMASPLLLKMGWSMNTEVHVLARIRRGESLGDQLRRGVQCVNRMVHPLHKHGRARISLTSSLPSPELIDAIWQHVGPSYGKAVCRTGKYLHWRYGQHPLANYRFLLVEVDAALSGIGVLREDGSTLRLVDYVGALDRPWLLRDLIASLDSFFPSTQRQVCVASHPALQIALLGSGFLRTRDHIRFYVRSSIEDDPSPAVDWFIMSGDSDGEILAAARAGSPHSAQASTLA